MVPSVLFCCPPSPHGRKVNRSACVSPRFKSKHSLPGWHFFRARLGWTQELPELCANHVAAAHVLMSVTETVFEIQLATPVVYPKGVAETPVQLLY